MIVEVKHICAYSCMLVICIAIVTERWGDVKEHKFGSEYGFQTRAVHTGNDIDKDSGAIKRPITMGNSYALPYDPSDMNWSSAGGNLYTRNGGTNQRYLQERLASLEGGEDCVVLASGVAALSGLFLLF